MHLRRALLLFAIVLGLAAVAASISRPGGSGPSGRALQPGPRTPTEQRTPTVSPGTATPPGEPAVARTFHSWLDQTRRIAVGQPATVTVEVDQLGQVSIPDLGLSDSAEPVTPAEFDVYTWRSGRYRILFVPAAGDESDPAGTLVVRSAGG